MNIISTQYTLANRSFEIYLAGCNAQPHCEGCFSPETWDYNAGESLTTKTLEEIVKKIKEFDTMIDGIWILGGDPIDQDPSELFILINELRRLLKPIWLFTRHRIFDHDGYLLDEYKPFYNALHYVKYVKTGDYRPDLLSDHHWVNGIKLATKNQRFWTPVSLKGYVSLDLSECEYHPPVAPWSESAQWVEIKERHSQAESIEERERVNRTIDALHSYVIKPVPKTLDKFLKILNRVYSKENHCPCSIKSDIQHTCMCEDFRLHAVLGESCHCGLYRWDKKEGL